MSKTIEYFPVIHISRATLIDKGFDADKLTDREMQRIASKMGNTYLDYGFWNDLEWAAEYVGVPRLNKEKAEDIVRKTIEPILKQFLDLKAKHPDAILLFRCSNTYEIYMQDAEKASKILGVKLIQGKEMKDSEGNPFSLISFPYQALDSYLPKLIRAGERVAIGDQLKALAE